MIWFFMVGCTSVDETMQPNISTIQTTVEFIGTPLLEHSNGDVFNLGQVSAVLYSVRFMECEDTSTASSFLPINYATAGHSEINIPSNWNRPTYIDVLNPVTIHAEVSMTAQSVCLGAVTWARWDGGTVDLPSEEPEMAFSMYLRGSCEDSVGNERFFELFTAVPSEKIDSPISLDDGIFDTLKFTVVFDTTELLHKIECNDDTLGNTSSSALQVLFNLQNNAHWIWEWE